MAAPLYRTWPGTVVKVVNSYAATARRNQWLWKYISLINAPTFGMLTGQPAHERALPNRWEADEANTSYTSPSNVETG